ncbi:DEAD/DEAH box helicase family protein [Halobacillus trueperi]|uniref:DNA helicase n=1 Tax=Halobacillus trueperi TaxID=156205 RepID=A0A3E0J495_9BACI|nr:DEAD/DEAH box helicase family protein [Halobacillus trueperi]REJ07742.1 DNA helicase [Halobacillus trueperi]
MSKNDLQDTKLITNQLVDEVLDYIHQSNTIYILSAFIMKSGVQMLYPALKEAASRGADIKILTGDYLYVTQPEALELLSELPGETVEIRLWQSRGRSFHPKAFMFNTEEDGALIVGSSNLSNSALTNGVEWNLYMQSFLSEDTYEDARNHFIKLFSDDTTMKVNKETIKKYEEKHTEFHNNHPELVHHWTKQEEVEMTIGRDEPGTINETDEEYQVSNEKLEPRFAQPAALEALLTTREEGYDKAMVVMATGLGKTYLAAFLAEHFERVLFVAHREEILYQAKASFEHVQPDKTGGIYNGKVKDMDHPMIFASIFTLSINDHLKKFDPSHFDLIVIDEFHHASNKSYQNILRYFVPQFLMGITATPERTDGQDIFALCDGNVAYEMNFIQAIQKDWLSPFHYYGVYDDIDYSKITWLGNRYDEEELIQAQLQESTAKNIIQNWEKHKQTRTLCFCSNIKQAEFLSNYFQRNGYQTIALHSKTMNISRKGAIEKLENGEIDAIFTVDLFNEGTDIPSVDTILFVRPTESLVVFTQQIGRGLRKHHQKSHCTIIDMIGNYRNADVKLKLFDTRDKEETKKGNQLKPIVPAGCQVEIDTRAVKLLEELLRKRSPRKERVKISYDKVKEELGRRPTYEEMHLRGSVNSKEFKQIWKSYGGFLSAFDELSYEEENVYSLYSDWIEEVERTSMTKSYKMVVLQYMLSRGELKWTEPITPEEVAPYFHEFFMEYKYRRDTDFSSKNTKALWKYDKQKVAKLIADMPLTKWSGSSRGLVQFDNGIFSLSFHVSTEHKALLYKMTEEICNYRLHSYFEKKQEILY